MSKISDTRILILATHGFEQSELLVPRQKLRDAGAQVVVASPEKGQIRGWKDKDWGESVPVDALLTEVQAEDYDALVLPGGQINPDLLRVNAAALQLIHAFVEAGKVVAAVCRAVVAGRNRRSSRSPGDVIPLHQDRCDQRRRQVGRSCGGRG